jgi:molecular chaperone GrpE
MSGPWGVTTGEEAAGKAEDTVKEAVPAQAGPKDREPEPEAEPLSLSRLEKSQIIALESQLRRALADLDNMRKRFDREITRQLAGERARVTAEWLPVVDNLERALEHAVVNPEAVVEGLQAVRDQAIATLDRLGYPRYDDVGHPFDPEKDEAVGTTVADAPEGTVVVAVRPGYGTSENILRPAAVIVSRGAA